MNYRRPGGLFCKMIANQRPSWAARLVPWPAPPPRCRWPGGRTAVVILSGVVGSADVPAVCTQVAGLLAGCPADRVVCDVAGLSGPATVLLGTLARLALTVGRLGREIAFQRVPGDLAALLTLTGLAEFLPVTAAPPARPGP